MLPEDVEEYIRNHYNRPIRGYPGINKTIELIRRTCVFPKIKQKIAEYIEKYIYY